jgi:hypothetical protein
MSIACFSCTVSVAFIILPPHDVGIGMGFCESHYKSLVRSVFLDDLPDAWSPFFGSKFGSELQEPRRVK